MAVRRLVLPDPEWLHDQIRAESEDDTGVQRLMLPDVDWLHDQISEDQRALAPADFIQAVDRSNRALAARKVTVGSEATLNQETRTRMAVAEETRQAGEFQRQLRSWRNRKALTQRQLAEQLGYDVTYIAKLEGGTRRPSPAFLARWSQLAGQSQESLLHVSMGDISRPSLPRPTDTLVGRDEALEAIVALLLGSARCVTLVGASGIGKTRLATEAAQRLGSRFAGGVWWVPQAHGSGPADVWHSLLRSLALPDRAAWDPADAVLERLGGQEALVVLDNFEHVIAARRVVSRLVEGSQATVLVTSREVLEVVSERVFAVTPLLFPDPATDPSYDEVRTSPAVELFVARATMARPDFRLTPSNFATVLAACARCDGIPLAIVQAAGGLTTIDS